MKSQKVGQSKPSSAKKSRPVIITMSLIVLNVAKNRNSPSRNPPVNLSQRRKSAASNARKRMLTS